MAGIIFKHFIAPWNILHMRMGERDKNDKNETQKSLLQGKEQVVWKSEPFSTGPPKCLETQPSVFDEIIISPGIFKTQKHFLPQGLSSHQDTHTADAKVQPKHL